VIYIRDEDSGEIWSITRKPSDDGGAYKVTHGFGYSQFEHVARGLEQRLTMFAAGNDPVKILSVATRNTSSSRRRLSLTYYVRPVLGVNESKTAPYIVTSIDEGSGMLLIENKFGGEFRGRVAYIDSSVKERSYSGDRWEFFGQCGSLSEPGALCRAGSLGGTTGAGLDPCAVMQVVIEIEPDAEENVIYLFGQEESVGKAAETAARYRSPEESMRELERVKKFWRDKLEAVRVTTPDEAFDIMVNGWLLYQVLSCRVWSRSAFYQSGGAFGFRDQLQDSMALLSVWPEQTRRQILLHASRQFPEGDVQHWWHMGTGRGIRTRYSDDLLWLPYVTAEYIEKTGDMKVLDEEAGFINAPLLAKGEDERYEIPSQLDRSASLYEHCCLAIDASLRTGPHGIPLMGCGDWNDGMNTVGNGGKGESIWLGWFLFSVLKKFMPFCLSRNDTERYNRYGEAAAAIVTAIENEGWDGSWYRRAYFDDGTPLGSAQNFECRIDAIAQSWSVISGAARPARMTEAMGAVEKYLVDREEGIIKLLSPPFDDGDLKPGYIKGYVPGVRENGGQYTHAAAWTVLAFAKLGMGNKAWELFGLINPVNHARTPIELNRYKTEPYVVAADVYAVPPNAGRGGWTWYTGAAGWIYRTGIEDLLGLKKKGGKLRFDPCIPEGWRGFEMEYSYGKSKYIIQVYNQEGTGRGVKQVKADGSNCPDAEVVLVDDGKEHLVEVFLGRNEKDINNSQEEGRGNRIQSTTARKAASGLPQDLKKG
jgi:cellobiose phosphorylase